MEKPITSTEMPEATILAKLEKRGGKAIIGRVVNHVAGQERVEVLRLEDGTEIVLRDGSVVAKWPVIEYPREEGGDA